MTSTNAKSVVLRPGRSTDAKDLAQLHVSIWRATYRDYAPSEALALLDENRRLPYWRDVLSEDWDEDSVLVAERQSEILGVISFGKPSHPAFEGRTEIKHLYVTTAAQGQGIGKMMLSAVLEQFSGARQPSVGLAVVRPNKRARDFYAKMGGIEVGGYTDPGPLWRSDNIVVAWDDLAP